VSLGAVPQLVLIPDTRLDDLSRVAALIERAEPRVARRFLQLIEGTTSLQSLETVAGLLEVGNIPAALAEFGGVAEGLATSLELAYRTSGLNAAEVLRSQVDTVFDFNSLNRRSVAALERERLRLVAEFTAEQRVASRILLRDAFGRGLAPIEQARILKGSIGLTAKQSQGVVNFRRLLEEGSERSLRTVLSRQNRDRRFDPSIRGAIRGDRVLSATQIDRMVERNRERAVQLRARTIARTETVAAVHAGDEELWRQAIEDGVIQADQVVSTWHIAFKNVRPSHVAMNNQKRPFGVPFLSGDGNQLRFPGDPRGPASDTINCQCVVGREIIRGDLPPRASVAQPLAAG
jgi:hypothetical protein